VARRHGLGEGVINATPDERLTGQAESASGYEESVQKGTAATGYVSSSSTNRKELFAVLSSITRR
jgi:hypothetical protein